MRDIFRLEWPQELCLEKMMIMPANGRTFRSRELTDFFATKNSGITGSIAPAEISISAVIKHYENTHTSSLTDGKMLYRGAGLMCWIRGPMTFTAVGNFLLLFMT